MALNTFVLEVTDHDGKVSLHGCGVGGTPNITAEGVAEHLAYHNHFQGKAAKIVVKHRSHTLKKTVADVQKGAKKVADLPKTDIAVDKDANHLHPMADGDPNNLSQNEPPSLMGTPTEVALSRQLFPPVTHPFGGANPAAPAPVTPLPMPAVTSEEGKDQALPEDK